MADGDKFLYTGALLYCDKGCALTPFYASAKASYLYGSFTGTSTDNMPLVNVLPFGVCLAKHGTPCLPLKLEWTKYHNGALKIGKARPLLVTSECKCSFGGTIRVFETRAAVVAALNKMPSGKDKQRLQKAYNDQVKSYNEMLKQGKILKVASIPQRKTALEDLKETWDGIKGLSKVITATVIWDVAVLKGQDGDAAVKSAGESIGVDLDSTNKAINDFNCALDNMTTGEKAKLAGKAIVSFFDCESPVELISGVGFMKAAKTVKTVEEVKKVQTLAKEVKAIETATTKATVEGQKVVKGIVKVKKIKLPPNMTYEEYLDYLKQSVHNPESETMVLGKFKVEGTLSYIEVAKAQEATYFLLDDWGTIADRCNFGKKTTQKMFDYFNAPALDDAIKAKKTIQFSHDPIKYRYNVVNGKKELSSLGMEFDHIAASGKYDYIPETMTFIPK